MQVDADNALRGLADLRRKSRASTHVGRRHAGNLPNGAPNGGHVRNVAKVSPIAEVITAVDGNGDGSSNNRKDYDAGGYRVRAADGDGRRDFGRWFAIPARI